MQIVHFQLDYSYTTPYGDSTQETPVVILASFFRFAQENPTVWGDAQPCGFLQAF